MSEAQWALNTVTNYCCSGGGGKKNKKLVKLGVEVWQEKSGPSIESVSACVSFIFGQVTSFLFVLVLDSQLSVLCQKCSQSCDLDHINTNVSLSIGFVMYLFIFFCYSTL